MKCSRCGRGLDSGAGAYILTMTFIADVDDDLSRYAGSSDADMRELLEEIENTPEDVLTAQVYQKKIFTLCRPCKESFAADPFGKGLEKGEDVQ